jgi:hypothetical protein
VLFVVAALASVVRVGVVGATSVAPEAVAAPPDTVVVAGKVVSRAERELAERGLACPSPVACAAAIGAWARLDRIVLLERAGGRLRASSVNVSSARVEFAVDVAVADLAGVSPAVAEDRAISAALFEERERLTSLAPSAPTTPPPPASTTPTTTPPSTATPPTTSTPPPPSTTTSSTPQPLRAVGIATLGGGGALALLAGVGALVAIPSEDDLRAERLSAADFNRRQEFAVVAGVVAGVAAVVAVAGGVVFAVASADDGAAQ